MLTFKVNISNILNTFIRRIFRALFLTVIISLFVNQKVLFVGTMSQKIEQHEKHISLEVFIQLLISVKEIISITSFQTILPYIFILYIYKYLEKIFL